MSDVFISVNSVDLMWANVLKYALHAIQLESYVWVFETGYGTSLSDHIKDGIGKSKVVIAFLTKEGFSSQWVNQEIGYAKGQNKLVVCLVESSLKPKGFVGSDKYMPFPVSDEGRLYVIGETWLYLRGLFKKQTVRFICTWCNKFEEHPLPDDEKIKLLMKHPGLMLQFRCNHKDCNVRHQLDPRTLSRYPLY